MQEILALGSAEVADILLENQGELYFKPTCVGTSSSRQYYVKNTSRIPLYFEWRMTNRDERMLTVEPRIGVIQPGEKQVKTSLGSFHTCNLLGIYYCMNYLVNNGLYCMKCVHSCLLFDQLLCGLKSSIMGSVPIFHHCMD